MRIATRWILVILVPLLTAISTGLGWTERAANDNGAVTGNSQAPSDKPADAQEEGIDEPPIPDFGRIKPVSFSPLRIARLINENKRTLDTLQAYDRMDLRSIWSELEIDGPEYFTECQANCEAELFKAELDGEPGRELILKLIKSLHFCRYLIFKPARHPISGPGHWIFLGFIDHEFNRYEMSSHRVIQTGDRYWFVVRGQTGSGTGFSSYDDTWYELSDRGIREVLNYQSGGHIAEWPKGIGWELKSSISQSQESQTKVAVHFNVAYRGLNYTTDEYLFLFSRSATIGFEWDPAQERFVFSSSDSQISEDEFDGVYQYQETSSSKENILKYNLADLMKIADGNDLNRKEWLRDFVSGCGDTAEKTSLIKTLER